MLFSLLEQRGLFLLCLSGEQKKINHRTQKLKEKLRNVTKKKNKEMAAARHCRKAKMVGCPMHSIPSGPNG